MSRKLSRAAVALGLALLVSVRGEDAAVAAADDLFSIETWSTDRGLPQSSVNALVQSLDGYLWMGTYNGLARFDGVRFVVFDSANTPAMRNSRVTSLYEDSRTNLWIGHETGELTRYRAGVFHAEALPGSWQGASVQDIGEDEHADVWILGGDGSALRLPDGPLLGKFPGVGREPGGAPQMTRDRDGRLLVSRNGAVAYLGGDHWIPVGFDDPTQFRLRAIPARSGGLWVAGNHAIRRWHDGRWVGTAGSLPEGDAFIPTLTETRTGRLLSGSLNRGLLVMEPGKRSVTVGTANGLPSDWIKSVLEDREGNLWLGSRGGVSVLRPRKVVMRGPPDQWQYALPLGLCFGADGSVWSGSEGSGLYRLQGQSWTRYGEPEGLSNPYVWSVIEASDGALWAGTWSGGLFRGRGGKFAVPDELADLRDPVPALLESPPGTLWIGTGKGLARFAGGRLVRFAGEGGAASGDIRALEPGTGGDLWVGTLGAGLGHRSPDGKFVTHGRGDGLPSDFIISLRCQSDGTLWIGTLENGLCRFKNGRFATIDTRHGLPSSVVGHIAEDDAGNLWFNSVRGIFSTSRAELDRVVDDPGSGNLNCLLYGIPAGLRALGGAAGFTPSGFRHPDGRLWFPTAKGVAIVNPRQVKPNRLPPLVAIEEVSIGGHPVAARRAHGTDGARVLAPPGSRQIEIRFTALSFSAPEKVRFKWRLEGLEHQWSEPQSDRQATYSYLHPGSYEFRVMACNNDGLWNEIPASIGLEVAPFLHETLPFKASVGFVVLLSFGAGIAAVQRWRLRAKLERTARERELERERARIAQDIHDDLGASLTRIGMLSQTAGETPDDPVRTARYLAQIYAAAREMTRGMDEIVWAVNPRHDTLESLFNYLARFAHEYLLPAKIRCRLQVPVDFASCPVRSEVRHNLFLAFKETLHNAVRHSGADEVQVAITFRDGIVKLDVADNGNGIPDVRDGDHGPALGRISSGHGLANIQSRLDRIGGRCRITSEPGHGMRVELWVPLSADAGDLAGRGEG